MPRIHLYSTSDPNVYMIYLIWYTHINFQTLACYLNQEEIFGNLGKNSANFLCSQEGFPYVRPLSCASTISLSSDEDVQMDGPATYIQL